jgi:hypothetical protein
MSTTRSIEVFSYDELSPEAQAEARDWFRVRTEFLRADEYLASIEALAAHFGGRVKDYELDWSNSTTPSSMEFEMPDMDPAEIEARLNQLGSFDPETLRGHGDCKLTGMCYDENAIDGFRRAFFKGETDLESLMQAAFDSWIESAHKDYDYDQSDEAVAETIQANDFRFTAEGKRTVVL